MEGVFLSPYLLGRGTHILEIQIHLCLEIYSDWKAREPRKWKLSSLECKGFLDSVFLNTYLTSVPNEYQWKMTSTLNIQNVHKVPSIKVTVHITHLRFFCVLLSINPHLPKIPPVKLGNTRFDTPRWLYIIFSFFFFTAYIVFFLQSWIMQEMQTLSLSQ